MGKWANQFANMQMCNWANAVKNHFIAKSYHLVIVIKKSI